MYVLEIAQNLLYLSIVISFAFFVVLTIHSLVVDRKKAGAGQSSETRRTATHVRPSAPRPSISLATDQGALSGQSPGRPTKS